MGILRRSIDARSVLQSSGMPPFLIHRPPPSATFVALAQTVAVGAYFNLGGAGTGVYRAAGVAGRDCTLPVPASIAFITASNGTTGQFEVIGLDHLYRPRTVRYSKTTTNRQTAQAVEGQKGGAVWSQIYSVQCLANSVPAETLRIGVLYSGFAKASADLDTRLANDVEASPIYLPLPFVPDRTTEDFVVWPFSMVGYAGTLVDDGGATSGGFAFTNRVPPCPMSAFGLTTPALDIGTRTFQCFPKATTDPSQGVTFAVTLSPGAMWQR